MAYFERGKYMNGLDKLIIGKKYTYDELCVLFQEEKKSHHSKDSQKKRWSCYFRWSNPSTQKYLIEEIYDVPLEMIDGRRNNGGNSTSKFLKLDDILMDYFDENENISTTMPKLAVEIGLLSRAYELCRNDNKEYSENSGIPKYIIDAYLANIQGCVLHAIRTALERLKKEYQIDFRDFFVLVQNGKGKVELSTADSQVIVSMENQVRNQLGITLFELSTGKKKVEFYELMRKKIFEKFGYDIAYYYRKYKIRKLDNVYNKKSNEDTHKLTRKFIITIGTEMFKSICSFNIPEYSQSQLIKDVIDMTNHFFVYMNHESWDMYWNEDELDWKNENKAMRFWSQYCLIEANDYNEKEKKKEADRLRRENEYLMSKIECRNEMIDSNGEEVVLEYEYILPELDWKKVFDNEEYADMAVDALNMYYDIKRLMKYVKDEPVEEYALYSARLTFAGRSDDIIPFYEFEKDIDENLEYV